MRELTWIQPVPDSLIASESDPAEVAVSRETIRLVFGAALQYLRFEDYQQQSQWVCASARCVAGLGPATRTDLVGENDLHG